MRPGRPALRPSKRFAQHFLRSRAILERIVDAAEISGQDAVLEIGPGMGDLTLLLALRAREVLALELDRRLHLVLLEKFRETPNVRVLQQDALTWPLPDGLRDLGRPRKVVANLPYNVATQILVRFAQFPTEIDRMVLMFQKEVAERLTATCGSPAYGGITLILGLNWETHLAFKVGPGAFYPSPGVESAVVVLHPLKVPRAHVGDEAVFRKLVRAAFGQRRKTLLNALQSLPGADRKWVESLLERAGIDGRRRAETLSLEEFARLSRAAGSTEERRGRSFRSMSTDPK